ncbi:MAG: thymidylate synthase, partial [Bacteroidota bacterium]|nr:thymidylate synthase [Bacteroidota bacterium]
MQGYLDTLDFVLTNGTKKEDRTNTGTISYFGLQTRYNLQNGFPLVTTKKIHFKSVLHELLWFIKGQTNTKYLTDNGVKIWNPWADEKGELGKIYGYQWRSWTAKNNNIDQLKNIIENLKSNPDYTKICKFIKDKKVGSIDLDIKFSKGFYGDLKTHSESSSAI